MKDENKTEDQLLKELKELRERLAAFEGMEAQRRQTEEELAKSKAILTAAIECLPFDFFALDPDGRCILQNAVSRQYYGNALGKTAAQVCPDEHVLPRWIESNRRVLGGEPLEREVDMQVRGDRRHFYSILAPIQADGSLYGMLGVNVDITVRRQAEEALRESEERYRALAESTRDIIYIVDQKARSFTPIRRPRTRWGSLAARSWARGNETCFRQKWPKPISRRSAEFLLPARFWKRTSCSISAPRKSGSASTSFPSATGRDKSPRSWEYATTLPTVNEPRRRCRRPTTNWSGGFRSVQAELVQANEALGIFRKFADASSQGFSMADLDGHITYMNPALCRMLGLERAEDAHGEHLSICYSEQSNRRGKEEIEPALKQNGRWEGELPMLSRQAKSIPTWHNAFVIPDESGSPVRLAVVITDISERKRAEEALRSERGAFPGHFRGSAGGNGHWRG